MIGGYDLINEPVLPDGISSMDLRELYINITNAIREVDQNHIIYVEGIVFATSQSFSLNVIKIFPAFPMYIIVLVSSSILYTPGVVGRFLRKFC